MATTPVENQAGNVAQGGKDGAKIHELAGGWITERAGTPIPGFLKLAYIGFCLFGLIYLFRYSQGEVDHATRGPLVQQFNQIAQAPPMAWIAFLGAVLLAFVIGLLLFAFRSKEDE